jgi:uncharacterized membrane protein
MAKSRPQRFSRYPIRSERERAVVLLSVLGLFLAVYVFIATRQDILDKIDSTVVAAITSFVSIGIAVLVTTFSFVFVALSLVSMQFSPRVVRHFWHADRFRFVFLWSSVAVFAFCFFVQFFNVPRLHLLGLVIGSYQIFVLFPVFLGYLADNINAASITKNISDRTVGEIATAYELRPDSYIEARENGIVVSRSSGFFENLHVEKLIKVFSEVKRENSDVRLNVSNYAGSFIEVGSPLAYFHPPVAINEQTANRLAGCFSLNKFRSYENDIDYGIRQLVDIGIKAISPAVNDPTTCVNCIHQIGVIVKELTVREDNSKLNKRLKNIGIIIKEPSYEQFLDDAFDQIYQFGRRDHVIVHTIIGVLAEIIPAAPTVERAETLVNEIDEMELTSLLDHASESQFALREYRNYARKSLIKFYSAAAQKFETLGRLDRRDELNAVKKKYEDSFEVVK